MHKPAPSVANASSKDARQELFAYEEYKSLCEARQLTPVPLHPDWPLLCALWPLGDSEIPYVSSLGSIWVRDLRHKTGRRDRPLQMVPAAYRERPALSSDDANARMDAIKARHRRQLGL